MTSAYARIVDWAEAEKYPSHPVHLNATLALMARLWASRAKLRFLVGGDVHFAAHIDYCPSMAGGGDAPGSSDGSDGSGGSDGIAGCIPQLISSGLTVRSTAAHELKVFFFDWFSAYASSSAVAGSLLPPQRGPSGWHMHLRSIALTENYAVLRVRGGGSAPLAGPAPLQTWCAEYPRLSGGLCEALTDALPPWAAVLLLDLLPSVVGRIWLRALATAPLLFAIDVPRGAGRLTWRLVVVEPDTALKRLRVFAFQTTPLWLPLLLTLAAIRIVRRCCCRGGSPRWSGRKGGSQ